MAAPRGAMLLNASLALALLGAGVASALQRRAGEEARVNAERHRPIESGGYGYASSNQCRSCHPAQYSTWHDSYHRTMTKPATPEYVHGDFGDGGTAPALRGGAPYVELSDGGIKVRMSREGDRFFIEQVHQTFVGQPERAPEKYPLALVTGSHHMQVYWYETGDGRRLGQVPFTYLKTEQRWIPRRQAFLCPPAQMRPNEGGRWNTSCIACHTTHGRPRVDDKGGLDTRVAELGIACEACHGPGLAHVKRNASPLSRYRAHLFGHRTAPALRGGAPFGGSSDITNPRELDHRRASQVCGQCHGIWLFNDREQEAAWQDHGFAYRPGGDPTETMFLLQPSRRATDSRTASVLGRAPDYVRGQFWPDGMARVSGREFNGMADSPCYARGELSCLSCHSMHREPGDTRPVAAWADDQLRLGMDGDEGCTQCHREMQGAKAGTNDTSPALRGGVSHTHHAPDSPGSRCYNCHMPYTSYGLLKAIRSHQVSSPSVQSTLQTSRPNACNLCHLDRSLGWTADALARDWGVKAPALGDDQRAIAASVAGALRGDAAERALWASAMGWDAAQRASGKAWIAPFLGVMMDDPYDAVRLIAARSLRTLPGFAGFEYDSVPAPGTRAPVAPMLARVAKGHAPPAVPLRADGSPREDVVQRLLAERDQRPIDLLE